MNPHSEQLAVHRNRLNDAVGLGVEHILNNWNAVQLLMEAWWTQYKLWEAADDFTYAFSQSRMSVRTFGANFLAQVAKEFGPGTISVESTQQDRREVRMFSDSNYTAMDEQNTNTHNSNFRGKTEGDKYHATRGIDSSKFADPANFATREQKYHEGLHDLSASLLNPNLSIFNQVHNNENGAHYSFIPLSEQDDQEMIYTLTLRAKDLKARLPAMYNRVRDFRAAMTRVKLANEFDMAVGYSAMPLANWQDRVGKPAPRGVGIGRSYKPAAPLPAYKLRYGLGMYTTITGENGQQTVRVTPEIYEERRRVARQFKSILGIREAKNEIVISIRQHAGPFPVYAVRAGERLKCFTIVNGKRVDSKTKWISPAGVMTG